MEYKAPLVFIVILILVIANFFSIAQDHVGLETTVTSQSVMVDFTKPVVNKDKVIVSSHYLTSDTSVQISYSNGAFVDLESGKS